MLYESHFPLKLDMIHTCFSFSLVKIWLDGFYTFDVLPMSSLYIVWVYIKITWFSHRIAYNNAHSSRTMCVIVYYSSLFLTCLNIPFVLYWSTIHKRSFSRLSIASVYMSMNWDIIGSGNGLLLTQRQAISWNSLSVLSSKLFSWQDWELSMHSQ